MKRPRKGKVIFEKYEATKAVYTCPFCGIRITDYSFRKNVTRFLCDKCKNEIIVYLDAATK